MYVGACKAFGGAGSSQACGDPTCVLGGADAVAVTLLVHGSRGPGCGQPPVGGEGVCGNGGVGSVEGPLAGVAVSRRGPRLGVPPSGGVCEEARTMSVWVAGGSWGQLG